VIVAEYCHVTGSLVVFVLKRASDHGLFGSNKLLYISDVPCQWEGHNFDPPQLPHFSTDLSETENQERYPHAKFGWRRATRRGLRKERILYQRLYDIKCLQFSLCIYCDLEVDEELHGGQEADDDDSDDDVDVEDDEDKAEGSETEVEEVTRLSVFIFTSCYQCLSLWLIGTVRAEPETVISRAWVQSPDPAE